MLKLFKSFIFILLLFISINTVQASEVNVHFFHGDGCPHCADEEEFLDYLKSNTYLDFKVTRYEIWKDKENAKFLSDLARNMDWNVRGVPFTVVGDKIFSGFLSADTSGKEIQNAIKECALINCSDIVGEFIQKKEIKKSSSAANKAGKREKDNNNPNNLPKTITLPLAGEINTKSFSLPILTIIIAAIDGFNPCAMWVLVFLIGMLLGMKDKKRRWILGTAFIAASGVVYFFFLAAWFQLFSFLMFIPFIKPAIGLLAAVAGIYYLREYFINKEAVCKVTSSGKRQLIFEKLKQFVHEKHFWLALGGIIVLAAAVNLVELVCSAGLPAIFTQILTLSNLPLWQNYAYMVLYIIIFMLDDMIVFGVAMKTLELKTISAKYSRFSNLIGGIIMLILGILLIFKPGWLI